MGMGIGMGMAIWMGCGGVAVMDRWSLGRGGHHLQVTL